MRKLAADYYAKAAALNFAPAVYNYAHAPELQNIPEAVKQYKRPHHNIYGLNPLAYNIAISFGVTLWIVLFLEIQLR